MTLFWSHDPTLPHLSDQFYYIVYYMVLCKARLLDCQARQTDDSLFHADQDADQDQTAQNMQSDPHSTLLNTARSRHIFLWNKFLYNSKKKSFTTVNDKRSLCRQCRSRSDHTKCAV